MASKSVGMFQRPVEYKADLSFYICCKFNTNKTVTILVAKDKNSISNFSTKNYIFQTDYLFDEDSIFISLPAIFWEEANFPSNIDGVSRVQTVRSVLYVTSVYFYIYFSDGFLNYKYDYIATHKESKNTFHNDFLNMDIYMYDLEFFVKFVYGLLFKDNEKEIKKAYSNISIDEKFAACDSGGCTIQRHIASDINIESLGIFDIDVPGAAPFEKLRFFI